MMRDTAREPTQPRTRARPRALSSERTTAGRRNALSGGR